MLTALTVAVIVSGLIAPVAAQAEPLFTASYGMVTWTSSDAVAIEATATPTLDWTIGSLEITASPLMAVAKANVRPKRRSVRRIIADTGRAAGLSKAEIAGLMWLAYRESRFHPTSHSRSNCHGLFQLSAGMAHGHPWKNPEWNTRRAIKYMRGRYGGVLKAKAFWSRHHWY